MQLIENANGQRLPIGLDMDRAVAKALAQCCSSITRRSCIHTISSTSLSLLMPKLWVRFVVVNWSLELDICSPVHRSVIAQQAVGLYGSVRCTVNDLMPISSDYYVFRCLKSHFAGVSYWYLVWQWMTVAV